jgi:threonine/homoserine/homoserine lactone efflux protein
MLGQAIGDLLPSAVGVALSPVPIVAVILMLGTPRARSNGPAFAVGWMAGLTIVTVVVLWLAGGADDGDSGTSTAVDIVKLVFGLVLLLVAVQQWRARPRPGQEPAMPKWMQALGQSTAGRSLGLGALLSGVNPKNLALVVAVGATLAQAGLSAGGDVVAVAVFVVIGSVTVAGPVLAYLVAGERARGPLESAKQFMAGNSAVIMAVVCLILAAKLVGAGLGGLTD